MIGLIDIGSNTIKAALYDTGGSVPELIFLTKDTAGLAGYVQAGALTPDGTEKLAEVLSAFHSMLIRLGARAVYPFATASLRNISNTTDVCLALKQRTGLDVRVLTGEEEAFYAFRGMMAELHLAHGLTLDIGGGSTELLFVRGGLPGQGYSVPLGALKLYKLCCADILPSPAELSAMFSTASAAIDAVRIPELLRREQVPFLAGIGGSVRAACALRARLFGGGNRPHFTPAELDLILRAFCSDRRSFTDALLKTAPERVHTMLPGLVLLKTVADRVAPAEIRFTSGGVRSGFLESLQPSAKGVPTA